MKNGGMLFTMGEVKNSYQSHLYAHSIHFIGVPHGGCLYELFNHRS